jgi:hypothetical protein
MVSSKQVFIYAPCDAIEGVSARSTQVQFISFFSKVSYEKIIGHDRVFNEVNLLTVICTALGRKQNYVTDEFAERNNLVIAFLDKFIKVRLLRSRGSLSV